MRNSLYAVVLAGALLAAGQPRDAIRLRASAHAERQRTLRPCPASYADDLERDLATARAQLGAAEAEALWAEGALMTIDDAVELARAVGAAQE